MFIDHFKCELPTRTEIVQTIENCKAAAMADAVKLGLIDKTLNRSHGACKIQPYVNGLINKGPIVRQINNKIWSRALTYLRTTALPNFAEKFSGQQIEPNSPYVEIRNDQKRIVIKKTSLCWLLRSDHVKLSSDRLERVKAVCGKRKLTWERKFKVKNSVARLEKKIKKIRQSTRSKLTKKANKKKQK